MTDRIAFYAPDGIYEAWADAEHRNYLGSFNTEAEARDAVQRTDEFDESEDAYERAYEEGVRESARTRQLFGYP